MNFAKPKKFTRRGGREAWMFPLTLKDGIYYTEAFVQAAHDRKITIQRLVKEACKEFLTREHKGQVVGRVTGLTPRQAGEQ